MKVDGSLFLILFFMRLICDRWVEEPFSFHSAFYLFEAWQDHIFLSSCHMITLFRTLPFFHWPCLFMNPSTKSKSCLRMCSSIVKCVSGNAHSEAYIVLLMCISEMQCKPSNIRIVTFLFGFAHLVYMLSFWTCIFGGFKLCSDISIRTGQHMH